MESVTNIAWKMRLVKPPLLHKQMDDATPLDALLPSPQGPQSQPPIVPMPSMQTPGHSGLVPSFKPTLPAMRFMFSHTTLYIAVFLAGAIISLSTPRSLLLQYVPNSYTSGGVVSWTGAAVLGLACVILTNFLNTFLSGFLG
jgi:hypothetical protein